MSHHGSKHESVFDKSMKTLRSPPPSTSGRQKKPCEKLMEKYTQSSKVICIECGISDEQLKAFCQKCSSAAHLICSSNQDKKEVLIGGWHCNKCSIIMTKSIHTKHIKSTTSHLQSGSKTTQKSNTKSNHNSEKSTSNKLYVEESESNRKGNETNPHETALLNSRIDLSKVDAQSTQILVSNNEFPIIQERASSKKSVNGSSEGSSKVSLKHTINSSKSSSKRSSKSSLSTSQKLELLKEEEEAAKLTLRAEKAAEEARQNAEFIRKRHEIIRKGSQSSIESLSNKSDREISAECNINSWVEDSKRVQFGRNIPQNSVIENRSVRGNNEHSTVDVIQQRPSQVSNERTILHSSNEMQVLPWLCPTISEKEFHDITTASHNNSTRRLNLSKSQIHARTVVTKDLPAFSGDPLKWPQFITAYINSTQQCGFTDEENMARLNKCLFGEAYEIVRTDLLNPSTLPMALNTLRLYFGRPELVFDAALQNLKQVPAVRMDKLETLILLSTKVKSFCDIVKSAGMPEYLVNPILVRDLVAKLPAMFKIEWARHRRQLELVKPFVALDDFNTWLRDNAEISNTLITVSHTSSTNSMKFSQRKKNQEHFQAVHSDDSVVNSDKTQSLNEPAKVVTKPFKICSMCKKKNHDIKKCSKFVNLSNSKRWYEVKKRNLCVGCLGKHWLRDCQSKVICGVSGCQQPHNPLLHTMKSASQESLTSEKVQVKPQASTSKNTSTSAQNHLVNIHEQQQHPCTYYQIVPITIYGANGRTVDTYAFLDGGSSVTLMEQGLVDELKLKGQPEPLTLRWTNNVTRIEESSMKVTIEVSQIAKNHRYRMKDVRTTSKLNLPIQSLPAQQIKTFKHLANLPIHSYHVIQPKVLIGLDNHQLTVPLDTIAGNWEEPIAIRTRLGWTLFGGGKNSSHDVILNHHSQITNEELHELIKNFFKLESLGVKIPCEEVDSHDNKRAMEILKSTVVQTSDGHYETGLLWRSDVVELPDSKQMALRRLASFEKKLSKDFNLYTIVRDEIAKYIREGYLVKVHHHELNNSQNRIWYLPIFSVSNPNKPGKTRIVWDAAAIVNGVSLNSQLLVGPDLLQSLVGILCKFRENKYAISGDIKQMFHQVKVRRADQDVQRCLWRDHPEDSPSVYRMTVMTFGASCSPTTAQFIKNINADKFKVEHPRAVEAIQKCHYVDDYIDSFRTIEECIEVTKQVVDIHKSGGFELRNFMSNSVEVLSTLNEEGEQVEKTFGNESDNTRVLGMSWNMKNDVLCFKIDLERIGVEIITNKVIPTKRIVLKVLMMIFDPLGFLGFFVVHGKIIMKEVWRTGIQWDEQILEEQWRKWKEWMKALKILSSIQIQRNYFNQQGHDTYELHVFVDASEHAASAVAYFVQKIHNNRNVAFVSSKTKIAPNKTISIPRLELQAAVMGVRLSCFIKSNHSFPIERCFFWSDSRNVLCWIRSPRSFKPFISHRIGEILETSNSHDWRWVPTADNVADLATKWRLSSTYSLPKCWFQGPDFLHHSSDTWPTERFAQPEPTDEELEVRHHVMVINKEVSSLTPNIERFSRLIRLVRTQVYVLRFFNRTWKDKNEVMSPQELDDALLYVIRSVQIEVFQEEFQSLKKSQSVSKCSALRKWSPFLDENIIIRMRSRLQDVDYLTYDQRHPIILPKRHHFTYLLVSFFHEKFYHQNHQTVLNEIIQRYAIPSLRSHLKSIRRRCMVCRLRDAQPEVPEMAVLPRSRTAANLRPFTYTGVDYFGPMYVRHGRRTEKKWGALFTCLTTRAVHVELVPSLSADAFILVLRMFVSRRGQPRQLFSDCGTNFKGAENELRRLLKENLKSEVSTQFAEVEFKFNPPAAPHMGGAWERLVRSIKSGIKHSISDRTPSEELLRSCLAEIESIVNSRPLTYVVTDGGELEGLTPNHFLLGSSSGVKPLGDFSDDVNLLRSEYKRQQAMMKTFWIRFTNEYLPTISTRTQWHDKVSPLQVGDVVAVIQSSIPYTWQLGRIKNVILSKDGNVRQVDVSTSTGVLRRPATKIAVLVSEANEVNGSGGPSLGGGVADGEI